MCIAYYIFLRYVLYILIEFLDVQLGYILFNIKKYITL